MGGAGGDSKAARNLRRRRCGSDGAAVSCRLRRDARVEKARRAGGGGDSFMLAQRA